MLQTFTPVTEQFVLEILQKSVPKSCDLDPISAKTAVRKPRCSPLYNHQYHQHFTGFWSCTTRLQNCYCQTPAQKTLPRPKCTEKTTVQSQTCHFCLEFLKRSFYINSLHTSKKTSSAILSNQPTAPDTVPRPHSYAL